MPTPQRGQASIVIAAQPETVYDLIADVTRMGEWSPECYRCEWLDGATAAAPGARFRGYNRRGGYRWERTAIVDVADRSREFAFTTISARAGRAETRWQYRMQPSPDGTTLGEAFEFICCSPANRALEMLLPRGRQMNRGIRETLARIKRAAEARRVVPGRKIRRGLSGRATPACRSGLLTPERTDFRTHILEADRLRRMKEPSTVNKGKTPPTDPLTSGERRAALIVTGVVVGVVAAGALAWGLTGHSSTFDRSGDGCVTVTFPSTMGGGIEHACGAAAHDWCRTADAQRDAHAAAVRAQCRVAGILP